jgi:hypothetical protein
LLQQRHALLPWFCSHANLHASIASRFVTLAGLLRGCLATRDRAATFRAIGTHARACCADATLRG